MLQDCRDKCFVFTHLVKQILAVYSSNLWDLVSGESQILTKAYWTRHMLAWDVPWSCLTFLVQTVSAPQDIILRASLLHRSVSFFSGLLASPSNKVAMVALVQVENGLADWALLRAALEVGDQVSVLQWDS